jgi:hypothetical protein
MVLYTLPTDRLRPSSSVGSEGKQLPVTGDQFRTSASRVSVSCPNPQPFHLCRLSFPQIKDFSSLILVAFFEPFSSGLLVNLAATRAFDLFI